MTMIVVVEKILPVEPNVKLIQSSSGTSKVVIEDVVPLGNVEVESTDKKVLTVHTNGIQDSQVNSQREEVKRLTEEVRAAHEHIHADKATVDADKKIVAADKANVQANKNATQTLKNETNTLTVEVRAAHEHIHADKATVAADKANVQSNKDVVVEKHGDVVTKHNNVVSKHSDVVTKHSDVVTKHNNVVSKHSSVTEMHEEVEADRVEVASLKAATQTLKNETNTLTVEVRTKHGQVEADRVEVAKNTSTVADDKAIVAADKANVQANKNATQTLKDEVEDLTVEVRTKHSEVEADRVEVAKNTSTVATNTATTTTKRNEAVAAKEAAEAARDVAISNKNTSTTQAGIATTKAAEALASANNAKASENAAAESERKAAISAAATTGAMIEMGNVDLSSGVYPEPVKDANGQKRSCFWKVTKGGTVGAETYGVGDSLVYSVTIMGYYKIDNTESVTSVNGLKGVVNLNSGHVGAVSKTGDTMTGKLVVPNIELKSGSVALEIPLNSKVRFKTSGLGWDIYEHSASGNLRFRTHTNGTEQQSTNTVDFGANCAQSSYNPTSNSHLTNKGYVDGLVNSRIKDTSGHLQVSGMWLRAATDSTGFLPDTSGTTGRSHIGTSSWWFKQSHIAQMVTKQVDVGFCTMKTSGNVVQFCV